MRELEKIKNKYTRIKEHTYEAFIKADEEKKKEIVQLLIATVFERQEFEEYTRLCDEMFNV